MLDLKHTIFDELRNLKRLYLDVEQRRYMTPGSAPPGVAQLRNIPTPSASSILRELSLLEESLQRITRKQFLQKILPSEHFCSLCLDELVEVCITLLYMQYIIIFAVLYSINYTMMNESDDPIPFRFLLISSLLIYCAQFPYILLL